MIKTIKNKSSQFNQVTKAVVLLAGYGTRCLPFTKILPKAMIPILNKPSIHYIIEELEKTQIKEVILVLPKDCNGKIVKKYFKQNKKYEGFLRQRKKEKDLQILKGIKTNLNIRYIFTGKANGGGGALLNAKKYIKNQPFILLNGDDLFYGGESVINKMIKHYNVHKKNIVVLNQVDDSKKSLYGIYDGVREGDHFKIRKMIEKPKPNEIDSNLAAVGRYLLQGDVFEILKFAKKHNGEIYVTDALIEYIKQNRLIGIPSTQNRIDGGNTLEIAKAGVLLALKDKMYKKQIVEFLNSIK